MPRKVFHAIRQLYGYMSFNKRRFGIFNTFTTTFLFKRDDEGTLFISKGIAANELVPLTLLEAITRLLLNDNPPAEEDLPQAEPTPPKDRFAQDNPNKAKPRGQQPEAPSEHDERELVLIADLPDYHVIATGGSASIVATELDEIPVAIKTVDTCKSPKMLDELYHECDAYTTLEAVQGDCIPILVRPAPVVLWEGMLDGLVLSLNKGRTLDEMGMDEVATIPLECRMQTV
ncbi:hypothetical protein H310_06329 [Aphanomyces invadans]|uniref:Uncharacterized protein n=1 Tax=Aphanomyces invadans TaxID=157072 RepID=A0A024U7Z4_9STRA|nr:hypothetical protein H310_06329 [Aphanomyces invadans]ETW01723.1 hypothetical protein H310_06329 [Aphanomyces invadans]|eukprot:XP_008869571.1 hypothetical protein H310_06329 [Aphanomyces invadans]